MRGLFYDPQFGNRGQIQKPVLPHFIRQSLVFFIESLTQVHGTWLAIQQKSPSAMRRKGF